MRIGILKRPLYLSLSLWERAGIREITRIDNTYLFTPSQGKYLFRSYRARVSSVTDSLGVGTRFSRIVGA